MRSSLRGAEEDLLLVCVAIAAVGIVVSVARGSYTVLEGLGLFVMASVFLGLLAVTDADDWFSVGEDEHYLWPVSPESASYRDRFRRVWQTASDEPTAIRQAQGTFGSALPGQLINIEHRATITIEHETNQTLASCVISKEFQAGHTPDPDPDIEIVRRDDAYVIRWAKEFPEAGGIYRLRWSFDD